MRLNFCGRQVFLSLSLFYGLAACDSPSSRVFGNGDDHDHTHGDGVGDGEFTTASLDGVSLELDDESSFVITEADLAGISGNIAVSIERDEIDADPVFAGSDVSIVVDRTSISSAEDIRVTLTSTWAAPSFNSTEASGSGQFHVIFTDTDSTNVVKTFTIPLQVTPIWEIRILGRSGGSYNFSAPPSTSIPACLRPHSDGLSLRFVNYDPTTAWTMHGDDPIDHQDDEMATAPAAGQAGGSYLATVSSTVNQVGSYYLHEASPADVSKNIRFNATTAQLGNASNCMQPQ